MKVRITITVDVDADTWAFEYGVDRKDVRADVKDYIGHLIVGSRHFEEKTITEVGWR